MAAVGAKLVSHIVRRSLEQVPATGDFNFDDGAPAAMFKNHPERPTLHIPPGAIFTAGLVFLITVIICASIDYTIGSLMASLAMIESPSATTILDPNPPAYTDEPDAPVNKNYVDDIPVVMQNTIPITAQSTFKFVAYLRSIGGFFSRWRGFGQYLLYHIALNALGHAVGGLLGKLMGYAGEMIGMTLAVMITLRLHLLWTHAMIGTPSSTKWYKRFIPRKQCKVLLLPSLVYALALQLMIVVPLGIAILLRLPELSRYTTIDEAQRNISNFEVFTIILRLLTVPLSAVVVALTILLPAIATLVRIEACLLPEEQETIVSFDREMITGDLDVTERGASKKIFAAAWKSFSRAARFRVVKAYVKSFLYQAVVGFFGVTIALTLFWLIAQKDIKRFFHDHQQ